VTFAALLPAVVAGCAAAPPVPAPPTVSYGQKIGWILRLEDQRVLRDPVPPPPVTVPARGGRAPAATPAADLVQLVGDPDGRVRRRAALAIGRVGLGGGVKPLVATLATDPEAEVRQTAAFALGLIGDGSAVGALRAALRDASPLVAGRAAEALATLGDTSSASAIGELVAAQVRSGAPAEVAPDDLAETHGPAVEAFRLGVLALGRLKAYSALASAVLDSSGRPLVRWWPVAFALQRAEDPRALPALIALAHGEGSVGRSLAARGLGAIKDPAAVDTLVALADAWPGDTRAAVSAVHALAQLGDRRAGPVLTKLLQTKGLDPLLQLEVIAALGPLRVTAASEALLDLVAHPSPAVRSAALTALRAIDPQEFLMVLSGLDSDRHWSVRATIASLLGTLDADSAVPRLTAMLADSDVRVVPSVLAALVTLKAPGTDRVLLEHLKHDDVVVRTAAAAGIGELKPVGAEGALASAFHAAGRDAACGARAAMLDALLKYGAAAARPVLQEALADKDWAVRVHAAALLRPLEPTADLAGAIRPAPTDRPPAFYESSDLVAPSVSPHVFVDTDRGTIEVELAVLDAPLTCHNFMTLARRGFFNGAPLHRVVPNFVVQDGDPRGDGEGGPGYTIRDERNERPFLRGTMGMAIDWADSGGSQFFLTHSPQPHLDGRYTAFGQVVAGLDVLDRLQPWDAIVRVRVWDGTTMSQ
jgi:cyclophilin family peptidyl-prolyl cis-trans isomerase/HEAT repeat protein